MSKQWGHGFRTGSEAGVTKGLAIGETTGRFQFATISKFLCLPSCVTRNVALKYTHRQRNRRTKCKSPPPN